MSGSSLAHGRVGWQKSALNGQFGNAKERATPGGLPVQLLLALTPVGVAATLGCSWSAVDMSVEEVALGMFLAAVLGGTYAHEAAHMVMGRLVSASWPMTARTRGKVVLTAVAAGPLPRREFALYLRAPSMLGAISAAVAVAAFAFDKPGWPVPASMACALFATQLNDRASRRASRRTCPHAEITEYRNGVGWKWKCVPHDDLPAPCQGATGLP